MIVCGGAEIACKRKLMDLHGLGSMGLDCFGVRACIAARRQGLSPRPLTSHKRRDLRRRTQGIPQCAQIPVHKAFAFEQDEIASYAGRRIAGAIAKVHRMP